MPPESLACARCVEQPEEAQPMEARPDELPMAPKDGAYMSLPEAIHAQLIVQVGPNSIYAQLLDALRSHDLCMPYQAPQHHFINLRHGMLLLMAGIPGPDDHLEFMTTDEGTFLPRPFFAPSTTEDRIWWLYALLRWCDSMRWEHDASKTLMGGPYAVKWPILVLILLRLNEITLRNPEGPRPSYYGDVIPPPLFSTRDSDELQMAAEELHDAIRRSIDLLDSSLQERSRITKPGSTASDIDIDVDDIQWHEIPLERDEWTASEHSWTIRQH
ncbi:hypothetical protein FS749_008838 [Ceratobasidium sp. UAMH 11750]|nr:hypothetical protein FS749_008838 [Ceratobasidium sp. UAMH 11750]